MSRRHVENTVGRDEKDGIDNKRFSEKARFLDAWFLDRDLAGESVSDDSYEEIFFDMLTENSRNRNGDLAAK